MALDNVLLSFPGPTIKSEDRLDRGIQGYMELSFPGPTIKSEDRLDRGIQGYMEKNFYVYMLASQRNGTLYIGVTSDLIKRVWEHKNKLSGGFTKKYGVDKLVYYEHFLDAENAISREKRLKKYNRKWETDLIEKLNPEWKDLYENLIYGFPDQVGE